MTTVSPIPEGIATLTPYLTCKGAADAIAFYRSAFGAEELMRLPSADGRLMHAQIRIGDSVLMLSDEYPEYDSRGPAALGGTPVSLHLYVADADAAFERAVAAGARVTMAVADTFWGDRFGCLEDPFGHRWSVATHVRDVSPEELAAGARAGCPAAAAETA